MDALHCNPQTLSQVAQAGGIYLVQVKDNQSELLAHCCEKAITEPVLTQFIQCDKGHGRVTSRDYRLIALRPHSMHSRWKNCQPRYLVAVIRDVFHSKTKSTTSEMSYYITNARPSTRRQEQLRELAGAIRGHWSVEANNWVRDVTLGEDGVRIKAPAQAQVTALLRGVALTLLRKASSPNLQALTEKFCHSPQALAAWLKQTRFL